MKNLWEAYQKLHDRRIMRYGTDEYAATVTADIEQTAYFSFRDSYAHWKNGDLYAAWVYDFDADAFFLPFPVCAVEVRFPDSSGPGVSEDGLGSALVLLQRPDGHEIGIGHGETDWGMTVVLPADTSGSILRVMQSIVRGPYRWHRGTTIPTLESFLDPDSAYPQSTDHPFDAQMIRVCEYSVATGKCTFDWGPHGVFAGSANPKPGTKFNAVVDGMTLLAFEAMCCLATANSPANWIVKVEDEHARIVKRAGKPTPIKRTRMIVVPDRELDRVVLRPNGASDFIERSPHRRRAHYRRLLSPRFRLQRGKIVFVKESWIGPKEAIHGGERYEVLTSLPSPPAA